MILSDFPGLLNIVTDFQYTKKVILYIETIDFIPEDLELYVLYI